MAKHNKTGFNGERVAESFLRKKGYEILHTNWRTGHREVDIIALLNNTLIIVEVKTRNKTPFGMPEEAVNKKKIRLLKEAAEAFLNQYPQFEKIQFDLVSITLHEGTVIDLTHFEDAFY